MKIKTGALLIVTAMLSQCGTGQYNNEGEAIYHTGKRLNGTAVENQVDRSGLPYPNIELSCAGCHGDDAKGRKNPIAVFGPYVAPDITWDVLTAGNDGVPYTENSFATTLQSGIVPEGYRLHHPMPTWDLTREEARSLVEYLKTK